MTYYEILGVNLTASAEQIRLAYRRLAKAYHPDLNPGDPYAEEHMLLINEAYSILSDPVRRSEYNGSPPVFTKPVNQDRDIEVGVPVGRDEEPDLIEVGARTVAAGIQTRSPLLTILGASAIGLDLWLKHKRRR